MKLATLVNKFMTRNLPSTQTRGLLKTQQGKTLRLWEVDAGVKGWDIRHTYTVAATEEGAARHRAKEEFKQWLATHTEISFAREAKLLKA